MLCCNQGWVCAVHTDRPWPHETCLVATRCRNHTCPFGAMALAGNSAADVRGSARSSRGSSNMEPAIPNAPE
jgi:hypothetical protein